MRTTSVSTTPAAPTEEQAREAMTSYVSAHLALAEIETDATTKIEVVKKEAADKATPHQKIFESSAAILMHYAVGNPQLFTDRRKAEIYGGHKIGFHKDPPSAQLAKPPGAKKKQTWAGFIAAIRAAGEAMAAKYLRTNPEPNKEALLESHRLAVEESKAKNDPSILAMVEAELLTYGIRVVQEDKFVIELSLPKNAAPAQEVAA